MTSSNDLLMAGGARSANLKTLNKWVTGIVIAEPQQRQQRDMQGNLETYDDGNPKMEVLIDVEIPEEDREDSADEDGIRRFYVPAYSKIQRAIRDALIKADAGREGVRVGGKLAVRWVGEEPPKTRGFNPTKLYEAKYQPPAQSILAAAADEDEDDQPF